MSRFANNRASPILTRSQAQIPPMARIYEDIVSNLPQLLRASISMFERAFKMASAMVWMESTNTVVRVRGFFSVSDHSAH